MIHTILDNFIVILLTLGCVFRCSNPVWLIILAGVLVVVVTMSSLDDEDSKIVTVVKLLVALIFAILSESFVGFVAFGLVEELKPKARVMISVIAYMILGLTTFREHTTAHIIVAALFLVIALCVLLFIKWVLFKQEERKLNDRRILINSNLSEMHEKRANQQLIMQSYLAEKNARLLERENISRNIHNSVGHSITAAVMTLDAADMLYDVKPDDARKKMNEANERIRGSLESIRQAVRVLDAETEGILAGDLKAAFHNIIDEFIMDTSMEADRIFGELSDDIKVPREHGEFLTGVLQELLTNGLKHGKATHYQVVLKGDNGHIRLSVADNGSSDYNDNNSSVKLEQGFGLKKIIAYVKRCGGEATFHNDEGFMAVVELPIMAEK